MGAEEALAAAAAEGLTLWRSNNVSGYRAVYHQKNVNAANGGILPVRTEEGDNMISHHGYFRTAAARRARLRAVRPRRARRGGETRLSEELGRAAAAGDDDECRRGARRRRGRRLVLERTDARADGSLHRRAQADARAWERNGIPAGDRLARDRYSRPFEASLQFNAKTTHLAWCATAEQAALLRARALRDAKAALAAERGGGGGGARARASEPAEGMLTAEEALARRRPRASRSRARRRPNPGTRTCTSSTRRAARTRTRRTTSPSTRKNLGFYESLEHAALVAARYVAAGGFRPGARGRPDPILLDGPRGAAVATPRKPPKDREAAASAQPSASASEAGSGKRKRAPNKVPSMSNMERLLGGGGGETSAAAAEAEPEGLEGIPTHDASGRPLSEYERQRLANIRSNERQLTAMLAAAEHAAEAAEATRTRTRRRWWRMPTRL